jgi:pilus assembly protein CpaF
MQNDDSHGPAGFGRRQHPSLGRQTESVASGTAARAAEHPLAPEAHNEDPLGRIKIRIFGLILDTIEVSVINKLGREQARDEITALIGEIVTGKGIVISVPEQEKITQDILNDMFGLGPIEPLMDDPEITDIMVNGHKRVFIERKGRIELTAIAFRDNAQLVNICMRIAGGVNRRVDESSPICDARLEDGSRVNIIIPPLAVDAPLLTIRRFRKDRLQLDDLVSFGAMSAPLARFLELAVMGRCNILISGGTGSGKTTLLNALSFSIRENDRIVTIEDTAELQLQQIHVGRLETRPANIEGRGEITQRDLMKNTLRMRPDRIIVGEVRGSEAFDMLQAMNTGHAGSMSTIHANTPQDCLHRLEDMVAMAGFGLPSSNVLAQIGSALDLIIQVERLHDGSRRLTAVQEVLGYADGVIALQDMFTFAVEGEDEAGRLQGSFVWSGQKPHYYDKIRRQGHEPALIALFRGLAAQAASPAD